MAELAKIESTPATMESGYGGDEESGPAHQVLVFDEPDDSPPAVRRRDARARSPLPPPPPPSPEPRSRDHRALHASWDRVDREERWLSTIVTAALLCGVLLLVLAHRFVLGLRPSPPVPKPTTIDAFLYRDYAEVSWEEYRANGTRCAQPSEDELAVWIESGEACSGTCLRIADVMNRLTREASVAGEAYSSMGRASRGAPVPCAMALREESGNVTAYLTPRAVEQSGSSFVATVEMPFFREESIEVPVRRVVVIEHAAWPSGARQRCKKEGDEAAQMAAALFVLHH